MLLKYSLSQGLNTLHNYAFYQTPIIPSSSSDSRKNKLLPRLSENPQGFFSKELKGSYVINLPLFYRLTQEFQWICTYVCVYLFIHLFINFLILANSYFPEKTFRRLKKKVKQVTRTKN